ncbi:capsid assembly scaffolding protein Gp46 family protein [Thomasclavelia spiroformis]|uniref:capsid assembly scaffolding protein Gp46 family protein n=1 Tax=Thomasclavelia spiroformis TaxID=29348 RepID=UPI0024B14F33|nr:DUF4355 domain-containing protein [Thomasclavelia spiroformis]
MNNNDLNNEITEQPTEDNTLSKERVFTQDDVNRIVSERLSKERDKLNKEYAFKNAELEQYRIELEIEQILKANNIPLGLKEILKGDDIDTVNKKIAIFKDEVNRLVEIEIANRLRGTTPKTSIVGDNNVDYNMRQAFGLN